MFAPDPPTFNLRHITDLHLLTDEAASEFQRALPGIVAAFRACERAYPGQLKARFDSLPFNSNAPDDTIDFVCMAVPREVMVEFSRVAASPAPEETYQLSHITDLALLADEHIAAFQADIPSMVATLRIAAEEADVAGSGPLLSTVLPRITFAPALGDVVVLRTPDSTRVLDGEEVRAAATPEASARRRARP